MAVWTETEMRWGGEECPSSLEGGEAREAGEWRSCTGGEEEGDMIEMIEMARDPPLCEMVLSFGEEGGTEGEEDEG